MAELTADDMVGAERDFDARMRADLPPALLRAHWQALTSKHGGLVSWSVARRDDVYKKDRFTLELEFSRGTSYALVVFDARGQVVGLFFSENLTPATSAGGPTLEGEVPLAVGPLALPGSLTLPRETAGRAPAVVLVAGSGPSDRDETVGNAKPFRDLASGLAARGIASLRFDKRSYAHPETFDARTTTVETESLIDAVAAVGLLRQRAEIDPTRIFVVGHSLGALLAPEIAERAAPIAGLVLLAAPGRPLPDLVLEQLRARGEAPAHLATLQARIRALPGLAPSETVLGVPARYWQDLAQRDELARAANLKLPVLLLRGEHDQQVAAIDQEIWLDALSGHTAVEAATLPGLSHLFVPEPTTEAAPHVAADVIARIADFILKLSAT